MSFRSQKSYVSRTNSVNTFETTYSVFYVNNGYMLGINASKDATIDEIHNNISDELSIPKKEQMIFLADGNIPTMGMNLHEEEFGTEKRPLFLYRRMQKDDPAPSQEMEGLESVIQKYENEYETYLANDDVQKFSKACTHVAKLTVRVSQKLLGDHEHLSKAWDSMVKFLDDRTEKLTRKYYKFETIMKKMEDARRDGHLIFNDFDNVFETLKRIILPPELLSASDKEPETTLYDWIRSKDPVYQLNDLITHVQEELSKLDDKPVKKVKGILDDANEGLSKKDIREIKNLDQRLTVLRNKVNKLMKDERSVSNIVHQVINNPDVLINSPDTLGQLKNQVIEMTDNVKVIIKCKTELLNVIRQRARKNFLTLFEVLFKADGDMIVFEQKAKTLADQMKLLNQIRETPILFATAVIEVIRRQTLQKEFNSWLNIHNEKCTNFCEEENKIREQFSRKFDKHFLRQIFYGMSDKMPSFASPALPFDSRMPKLDNSYLHKLRDDLSEMSSLLNVQLPDVYNKLAVIDKTSPISVETSHGQLRPNESFFTHEKTTNMETINRNFPSTNYLSGFDSESSPRSFNMHRFGFSSQTSLNFTDSTIGTPCELNPLTFDIGDKEDDTPRTSYYTKSDPICIPSRNSMQNQMSAGSSQFNTPDNEFVGSSEKRFQPMFTSPKSFSPRWSSGKSLLACLPETSPAGEEGNNAKTKEDTINALKDFKSIILSIQEGIENTKQLLNEDAEKVKDSGSEMIRKFEEIRKEMEQRKDEYELIVEEFKKEQEELSKTIDYERYLRRQKEGELEDAHNTIKKQNEELLSVIKNKDDLHADILKLETEKKKLEKSIEHSGEDYIDLELKTFQDILNRPLSDEEVDRIKSEVQQRRRVLSPTPSEQNEKGTRTSQVDYENALRKKMQLIIQGIENKKDLEIVKIRDEIHAEAEAERKEYEKLMQSKIAELEKKLALHQNINDRINLPLLNGPSPPPSNDRPGSSQDFINKSMQESCMIVNPSSTNARSEFDIPIEEDEEEIGVVGEDDVKEINTVGTQTRIRMKEMSMMISLQDIHEGCSVLVMWDNSHNSYMVFSTSRTLHFVRESCMKRFCSDTQSATRRNWMFAVVTHIDYCQIKKESNRYNMPLGTRFYRVDVKPLAIEQSSSAPSRRS